MNEVQNIDCCGQLVLLPGDFRQLQRNPEDPADSAVFGKQTEGTSCFLVIFPNDFSKAMPFEDDKSIAEEIHRKLGGKQGLIEIVSRRDNNGHECVYTVVKTLKKPSGVQYNLTMQIRYPERLLQIQGFFDEGRTTGIRDAMVLELAMRTGQIQQGSLDGWSKDPFDENYKNGIPRNLSESEEYDQLFPDHPLSVLRRTVRTILQLPEPENLKEESDSPDDVPTWAPLDYVLDDTDKPLWN